MCFVTETELKTNKVKIIILADEYDEMNMNETLEWVVYLLQSGVCPPADPKPKWCFKADNSVYR